jgi:hypothetical protein
VSRNDAKTTPQPGQNGADQPSAPDQPAKEKTTGRVKFDDRGNAIWEWSVATGAFGREVTSDRLSKLELPGLSIADDAPAAFETVKANPLGTKKGYDPYDSGKLGKPLEAPRKKKDLRKLSEWLALRKQALGNKQEDE